MLLCKTLALLYFSLASKERFIQASGMHPMITGQANRNPIPGINCINRLKSHAYHILQLHERGQSR
jgi:hypothetical protein